MNSKRNMELIVYHLECAGNLMKEENIHYNNKLNGFSVYWSLMHLVAGKIIRTMQTRGYL